MEKIKELRIKKDIKQIELARIMHASQPTVSYWESPGIIPPVQVLFNLCDIFNTSLEELLQEEQEKWRKQRNAHRS